MWSVERRGCSSFVTGEDKVKGFGLFNLAVAVSLGLGLASLLLVGDCAPVPQETPLLSSRDGRLSQQGTRGVTLTRSPYLQSVTTNSMMIVWETTGSVSSQVDYGPTTAYGLVVSSTIPVSHHALALTDLSPYSLVHYQASSGGQAMGQDSAFRTAAPPTQTAFSFVAFGDTRTNVAAHQSVVDRIVTLSPDFVLHVGDFVEDGSVAAQWTTFFTIEQNLLNQSPLFGVLGNHERNSANYFEAFHLPGNERWYSFDYGDAHFVALQVDGYASYAPGSAQYSWLDNDLANTDRQWKIVFFHVPPHSSGSHGGDSDVRNVLAPLFAAHGVDVVFNGHDHDYERSVVSDVVYIVTGGGGAPLSSRVNSNPYSVYFTNTYECVSVTINGRSLTGVGVRPDGVRFDLFTLHSSHVAADFTASPRSGIDPLNVVFTNTSVGDYADSLWDFGDRMTSTLKSSTHTYQAAGAYTVTLTVSGPGGSDTETKVAFIQVGQWPFYLPLILSDWSVPWRLRHALSRPSLNPRRR